MQSGTKGTLDPSGTFNWEKCVTMTYIEVAFRIDLMPGRSRLGAKLLSRG